MRWDCLSCSAHEATSLDLCFAPSPCCLCNHPAAGLSVPCGSFWPGWSLPCSAGVGMGVGVGVGIGVGVGAEVEAVSAQQETGPSAEATSCLGQGGLRASSGTSCSSVSGWGAVVAEAGRCWPRWTAVGPSASPCYELPSKEARVCPADPLWLSLPCETEDDVHLQLTPGSWRYLKTQEEAFLMHNVQLRLQSSVKWNKWDKILGIMQPELFICVEGTATANSLIKPLEGRLIERMKM